jgi:chromate transport protein ChrA
MTPTSLGEIGGTFLRLGLTSFGGPAAQVAFMRDGRRVQLGFGALREPAGVGTAAVALLLLSRGVGTVWLIAAGAAVGLIRASLSLG